MKYNFNWNIIQECRKSNRISKARNKDRKQYQHEYYLRVTKPKRHMIRKDGTN